MHTKPYERSTLSATVNGPILIAVAFALPVSTLSTWINTTVAVLLAVASAILLAKDTITWRQQITDEFAQHSLGLKLGQVFGPMEVVGLALATAGAVSGL